MTTILPSPIQNPHEPTSTQSTPGLEIPGAFPRELTRQLPSSDSRRAPDLPQRISLPSTEKEGVHPGEHCGGVGPLPGNISETSVAKLPDERVSERKAVSAPSSRSKELSVDPDSVAVAAAVAPASFSIAKEPGDERASEGEVVPEAASRPKELTEGTDRGDDARGVIAAASPSIARAPGDERAREGESASRQKELTFDADRGAVPASSSIAKVPGDERASEGESSSRQKEPIVDTSRNEDKGIAAAATSSGAPEVAKQDSPVRKTESQGQVPAVHRAEKGEIANLSAPVGSKFKEEVTQRREEKKYGEVVDEGSHSLPSSRAAASEELAPPKGGEERPNKAAAGQQPHQLQHEIVGGGPRKGRSSSDSDASNHAKASILNRVKGEMKMLLGKASGNREKVEEGEKLKHGVQ